MDKLILAFTDMMDIGYETMMIVMILLTVRLVLQWIRVPRKYICLLWLIPFLHMLIPVRIESGFSLMPKETPAVIIEMREDAEVFEENMLHHDPSFETTDYDIAVNNSIESQVMREDNNRSLTNWILPVAAGTWVVGMAVMAIYSILSYVRFRYRVAAAMLVDEKDNIYLADEIETPFVLCGKKMAVYLPSNMKEEMNEYVIAHEKEHIRRKDPIVKLIAYALCLVYWMNPFVWLAYYYMGRDMELACDEAVIGDKDAGYRKAYATTLLFLSVGRMHWNAVPLAFAEGDPKDRVERIAAYKKPGFWAIGIGIVCIVVLAIGLLSDPKGTDNSDPGQNADADKKLPEPYFEETELQPIAATVNLKASTGQGDSKLYYVDENKIIFGGYYGVFVFSKEEAKMIASVNLEELGWQDESCRIHVSPDGKYIYFLPAEKNGDYAYDWEASRMYAFRNDEEAIEILDIFENVYDEGKSAHYLKNGDKVYIQLREGQSMMIGDLTYREYTMDEEAEDILSDKYRHLFLEGKYKDVQAFEPEDIKQLEKAEMVVQGELRSVTDKQILSWVEKNLVVAEAVKGGTGCPFVNPLYLTREDGKEGVIYPATDSCTVFRTENGNYYDYKIGYGDNTEFWNHFEGWLEGMWPDLYRESQGDNSGA